MKESLRDQLANLSPERRLLLQRLLKNESIELEEVAILPRANPQESAPVSYAQERLWLLDQLAPGSPMYNIPIAMRVTGRLNREALKAALRHIAMRHEVLRATFATENDLPVQRVSPDFELSLVEIDMRGASDELVESSLRQEAQRPFDLASGPLVRIFLVDLAEDEYILLVVMHHIISDGWSLPILVRELTTIYAALLTEQAVSLPDLPIQYADFSEWQRSRLNEERAKKQLAYWKQQLRGAAPLLNLPVDRPRPTITSDRGGHLNFEFSLTTLQALKTLSRRADSTLFMTLMAAFQTLLYRYSEQDDILVGTPVANRNRPETENLIGFFVNTLVIRTKLRDEMTFRELLDQVREATVNAYENQDLPFEILVDELEIQRDLSYSPLFQVMMTLANTPTEALELPGLTLAPLAIESAVAKFDLTLALEEASDALHGTFEYNADLFDESTIARMAGHFQTLVQAIITDANQPVAELPLLTAAEKQQLLVEWNDTAGDFPQDLCAHELFEQQVMKTPEAVAINYEGRVWLTYEQLNRRANQLARYLQAEGIGVEALVAIALDRSPDLIVAILGIQKAGGAYVPLDPTYPPERLSFMLTDSQPAVLVTTSELRTAFPAQEGLRIVALDEESDEIASQVDENTTSGAAPDNLAYVIYTSGSTGRPKGTLLHHRGLCNLVTAYIRDFRVGPGSRFLQFFTSSFDGSVADIFAPLLSGGELVMASKERLLPGPDLVDFIRRQQITHAILTPSALAVLPLQPLPVLEMLATGGESCTRELVERWAPGRRYINVYGPTEATVVSTWYEATDLPHNAKSVPIGRPLMNTTLYIVDKQMQPVPIGIAGELLIGGVGVARGYLKRPELNAEKFIANPFSDDPLDRVYRTGDRARFLPDGNVEFLGRSDQQVKVRGFRIELGEIEATLHRHPDIQEVAVLVHEQTSGHHVLIGYVVLEERSALMEEELRIYLEDYLPAYMIPAALVILDELPLSPSGKVNRRALPTPDLARSNAVGEFVPPRTPEEELLAQVWKELLGVQRVGVHDDFFALGGHSLLATQVIARTTRLFQVELTLRDLFEHPTVAELARDVVALRQGGRSEVPPVQRVDRSGRLPLSYAQQRLWFFDQLEPGSWEYNIPTLIRLSGQLNLIALERSLNRIVDRHEILRTTFRMEDGEAWQVIAPEMHIAVEIIDLTALAGRAREDQALRLAREEARRPFDLRQGPLLRTTLYKLGRDEHIAILVLHHIVSDGWSAEILVHELAVLYKAELDQQPVVLPPLPAQYADYAVWQRDWLQKEGFDRELAYWEQQLAAAPPLLELPYDRPRRALEHTRGAHYLSEIPADILSALHEIGSQQQTTLFMTMLAAFQVLLHRYSGQGDILVGTPVANRRRPEVENLIGFFVNTLVLRADLSVTPTFVDLLRQVREVCLAAFAHQDLPFDKLVDALEIERDLSHTPLFQVMFTLTNAPKEPLHLPGLTIAPLDVDTGISTFDLTLSIQEDGSGLRAAFEYNADLFDEDTIASMGGHFRQLLEAIVADPQQPLSQLSLMGADELQTLLHTWNETARPLPAELLHRRFERQVAQTPEAIAVEDPFRQQHLTYAQLNRRSNQLAHFLRRQGIAFGDLVGVALQRSAEMVAVILGILKAGAAYVPLDPAYPSERLSFMINDSELTVLLTHEHLEPHFTALGSKSVTTYNLDGEWSAIGEEAPHNLEASGTVESLAYVIYTSGSTGQPKGVMVPHRAVLNHNLAVTELFELQPRDRVWQFATINFDAAAEEIFPTLFCGATLVLRDEHVPAVDELCALIANQQLSIVDLPTAYWHQWALHLSDTGEPLPSCLRLVIVGGEKVVAEHLALWRSATVDADVEWLNTYGPTETTIISTAYRLQRNSPVIADVPIGRPISNTQLYVLDESHQPVPIGVPGELYIGGAGLARGYLNQPELTAKKFVVHPFSNDPRARLYKTGDLVRYRPDGNLLFIGRTDDQVKLRGFRVELGEVEETLRRDDRIQDAAALVHEQPGGHQQLVAYLVPRSQSAITEEEVRALLVKHLPGYMVPAAFVFLEKLPISPSGKIDRRALPVPEFVRPDSVGELVSPRTPEEELLVGIWQELLNLAELGIHDNFFTLGGDSILVIQAVARARQAGLQVTPRQFFEHPTVAELARNAEVGVEIAAEQGPVTGEVPLTPIQAWFFDQRFRDPHHWNQSVLVTVPRPLRRELLQSAVSQLLLQHDVLRMVYRQTPTGWRQENLSAAVQPQVEWFDLSSLPEDERRALVEETCARAQARLNLLTGPLIRVTYYDFGAGVSARLHVAIHHLVVDGVSWPILLEDLQRVYRQLETGDAPSLPQKTSSYKQWAERLSTYANSPEVAREAAFWLNIGHHPIRRLPTDFSTRRGNTERSARSVAAQLEASTTAKLLRVARNQLRAEIEEIFLTALVSALYDWTGSVAYLLEMESHGRAELFPELDLTRTVGWFTAVYPVHIELSHRGAGDTLDILKRVKERLRRIPNKGIGYGLLRYVSTDEITKSALKQLPVPEVSFNYLGQLGHALALNKRFGTAPESGGPDRGLDNARQYILEVAGGIDDEQLQITWTYSENLHHRETITRLAKASIAALRRLAAAADHEEDQAVAPSDFPLAQLDQKELDKVLSRMKGKA